MASPILSKAWFNNPVTGLPYTGIFKNYSKSKTKMIRLTNAINYLINTGLLQKGVGPGRHLMSARKETYMKMPPSLVRKDSVKLAALTSININIDTYEYCYYNSVLPTNMGLSEETIKLIVSSDEFVSIAHVFNNDRIHAIMEERVLNNLLQCNIVHGKKQYCIIPASQQINNSKLFFLFNFKLLA